MTPHHILIIDDDITFRTSVQFELEDLGHRVKTAGDATSGVQLFQKYGATTEPFHLVLTDMRMPINAGQPEHEGGGFTVIEGLCKLSDDTPILVMTAYGTIRNAVKAVQMGAFDYIEKPFEGTELRLRVEKALAHRALLHENQTLKRENQCLFENVAAPYR